MTIKEIRPCSRNMLSVIDISEVIGSGAKDIANTVRTTPGLIRYPFTFVGSRMKIPRVGFLNWLEGKAAVND